MSRHNTDHYHTPNPADGSEAASKDAGTSVVYVRPKDVHLTLADLTEAESLVLWAIRTWVRGFMRDIPVAKSIVNGLRRAHAREDLYGTRRTHVALRTQRATASRRSVPRVRLSKP